MDSEIIAERNKYSKYPLVRPLNPPERALERFLFTYSDNTYTSEH